MERFIKEKESKDVLKIGHKNTSTLYTVKELILNTIKLGDQINSLRNAIRIIREKDFDEISLSLRVEILKNETVFEAKVDNAFIAPDRILYFLSLLIDCIPRPDYKTLTKTIRSFADKIDNDKHYLDEDGFYTTIGKR